MSTSTEVLEYGTMAVTAWVNKCSVLVQKLGYFMTTTSSRFICRLRLWLKRMRGGAHSPTSCWLEELPGRVLELRPVLRTGLTTWVLTHPEPNLDDSDRRLREGARAPSRDNPGRPWVLNGRVIII